MNPQVVLYSLFGPFLLWPVEYFFPYPFIVEELFKCVLVWFGGKNVKSFVLAGVAFAFTETVFYILNINARGSLILMIVRLISTSLLHSTTFLIIYLSARKNKKLIAGGFIASALIHYLYNLYIPTY
jgi:hypothetical protein